MSAVLLFAALAAATGTPSAAGAFADANAALPSTGLGRAAARSLPNPMIAAYTNWGECDDTPSGKVLTAAAGGVNVIIWFAVNLSPLAPPTSLNLTCIANVAAALAARGLPTTHLMGVGGWDAPHPVPAPNATAQVFYSVWKQWNEKVVARPGLPTGFDGVDWDMEGNDDLRSPWNTVSVATLDLIGIFSQLAKADGYLVTLVPCESYFDVQQPIFDRNLTWTYPEWGMPNFTYHGHNLYAYLWARYGGAFDAVTVQLYESWSHANYNITILGTRPADYLVAWARALQAGWLVRFGDDSALDFPSQRVALPLPQLVVGLANGWAGGFHAKSVLIMPEELGVAYRELAGAGGSFRGAAFWCIAEEGTVPAAQGSPLFLAAGLNAELHVRP